MEWETVLEEFRKGRPVAIARLINLAEAGEAEKIQVIRAISSLAGQAYVIGLTGPPGAGKSSLTFQLARLISRANMTIGVICIDPSSPFSGGAFLGDRVRMADLNNDPGIFIRSLATRGSLGGVSAVTRDVVQILDAAGKDVVLIETVGTGQVEHDIITIADTTVMVTVPGLGDGIQTLKAGIMEIADVFVVNKADRDGAAEAVKDLENMLRDAQTGDWSPPVLQTSALHNEGIAELWTMLLRHRSFLQENGLWNAKRRERRLIMFHEYLAVKIENYVHNRLKSDPRLAEFEQKVEQGLLDPYTSAGKAADRIISRLNLD